MPEHPVTDASRFVLGEFSRGEASELAPILEKAADAVETVIDAGAEKAMADFN
jgi:peptidyl-tRNA hydrolase